MDLKNALTGDEVMAYPTDDGEYILDTDASNTGIGATLSQIQQSALQVTGKRGQFHMPAKPSPRAQIKMRIRGIPANFPQIPHTDYHLCGHGPRN